jgi:hypothetical protein
MTEVFDGGMSILDFEGKQQDVPTTPNATT